MGKITTTITLILLVLAVLLNLNWLHAPILGVILSLAYLLIFGYLLGKIIFPLQEKAWQFLMGILSVICAYSLLGAIIYYFYRLDQLVISILILIISGIIVYFARYKISDLRFKFPQFKLRTSAFGLLTLSYLVLFAVAIVTLLSCQTTDVIRSTWQVIPRVFFLVYFLATLNLLLLIFKSSSSKIRPSDFGLSRVAGSRSAARTSILISLHFFLTTSIALIIYKLGYGFDPFIHQATELAIFKQGFILPKPLYYLGQYSLVVILAHMFQISVEWIDKLLLPILLSVFLPYTIYTSLTKAFSWAKNRALTLSLIFLIIPFELFIVTNPQALANLLAIIILFLSFLYLKDGQIPFWLLGFLALTTIAIHALTGIPILIYIMLIWLNRRKTKLRTLITLIFSVFAAISLPFALYFNSLISSYKIQFSWQSFNLINWPTIFSKQFNYFLDLAYSYQNSIYWLVLIVALITLYILIKQKALRTFIPTLLTFIILLTNAILLNFIKVSQIIGYEQSEFSQRVFQMAFYFLLPLVIYGFYLLFEKSKTKPFIYKFSIYLMLSLMLSLSLYLSYPRRDDYDNSKFINVSEADFQAANFIEKNSNGQPYIVLTNQMTSITALKTFGFTKYYNGQYFYPIPTGGELYKFYENMIYDQASRENMIKAMDFTEVKTAYFVLPFYWSRFETISQQAETSANAVYNLGDKVMVFKFVK